MTQRRRYGCEEKLGIGVSRAEVEMMKLPNNVRRKGLYYFVLFFVAITLMIIAAGIGEGKEIMVDDEGEGEYTSIQEAIDAAEDGDTIRVWEGTYYENVVVNKTVSLIGNNSDKTFIVGDTSTNVVHISADYVNMSGFNVTGCGNHYSYGAIKVESSHNSLSNIHCYDNEAAGIYLSGADHNVIRNVTCRKNQYSINVEGSYSSQ